MPKLNKVQWFHFRWTPGAGGGAINVNNFCFDPHGDHNYTYAANQTGKTSLILMMMSEYMKQNIQIGDQKRQLDSYIENTRADAPALIAAEWISDLNPEHRFLVLNWIYLISNQRGSNLKFSDRAEKYGAILSYEKGTLTNPVSDLGLLNGDDLDQALPKSCSDVRVALSDLPAGVTKVTGMIKLDNASPKGNKYFEQTKAMHLGRSLFEDVLKPVNSVEGGISKYFDNAKNSKDLLKSRLLPTVLESHKQELKDAEEMYANLLKQSADNEERVAKANFLNDVKPDVDALPLAPYLQSYQVLQDSWKRRFDVIRSFRQEKERIKQQIEELENRIKDDQDLQTQTEYSISYQELASAKAKLAEIEDQIQKSKQAMDRYKSRLTEIKRLLKKNQLFDRYQALNTKKVNMETARQQLTDAQEKLSNDDRKERLNRYGSQLNDFYRAKIKDASEKYDADVKQKNQLDRKVKETRKRVNGLNAQLVKNKTGQNNYQQAMSKAEAQVNAFNQEHQTNLQSNADYRQWNDNLTAEYSQADNKKSELQKKLSDARNHQQELNTSLVQVNRRASQAEFNLTNVKRDVNEFNSKKQKRQEIINRWKLSADIYDGLAARDELDNLSNTNQKQIVDLGIENKRLNERMASLSAGVLTKLPEDVSQIFGDRHLPAPQSGLAFLQNSDNANELLNRNPILPFAFLVDDETFKHLDQWLTQPLLEPLIFFNRDHLDEKLILGNGSTKIITNFDRGLLNNDYLLKQVQDLESQIGNNETKIDELKGDSGHLAEDRTNVLNTLNELTLENENRYARQLQQAQQNVEQVNNEVSEVKQKLADCEQLIVSLDKQQAQVNEQLTTLSNLQQAGQLIKQALETLTVSHNCLQKLQLEAKKLQEELASGNSQLTKLESSLSVVADKVSGALSDLNTAKNVMGSFTNQHGIDFNYIPNTSSISDDSYVKQIFLELLNKYQMPIKNLESAYREKQDQYSRELDIWKKESAGAKDLADEVSGDDFDGYQLKQQVNAISDGEADDLQQQIGEENKRLGSLLNEENSAKKRVNTCQGKVDQFNDEFTLLTDLTMDQLKQQLADIKQNIEQKEQQESKLGKRSDQLDGWLTNVYEITLPESSQALDLNNVSLDALKEQWMQSTNQVNKAKADFSRYNNKLVKQIRILKEKIDQYPRSAGKADEGLSNALQNEWLPGLETTKNALTEIIYVSNHPKWLTQENGLANSVKKFHTWRENIENSKEITAMNEQMNSLNETVLGLVSDMYNGLEHLYKSSRIQTSEGRSKCLFEFRQPQIGELLASENGQKQMLAEIKRVFNDQRSSFFDERHDEKFSEAEKDALYKEAANKLITANWLYDQFIGISKFKVKFRQLDHVLKGDAKLVNYEDSKASGAASQVIYFVLLAMILRYQLDDKQGRNSQTELLPGMNKNAIWVPLIVDNIAGKVSDSNLYKAILQYADQMHIQFITLADQKDNTSVMSAFGSRFGFLRKVKMGNSNEVQLVFSWKDWQTEDDGQEVDFDLTK